MVPWREKFNERFFNRDIVYIRMLLINIPFAWSPHLHFTFTRSTANYHSYTEHRFSMICAPVDAIARIIEFSGYIASCNLIIIVALWKYVVCKCDLKVQSTSVSLTWECLFRAHSVRMYMLQSIYVILFVPEWHSWRENLDIFLLATRMRMHGVLQQLHNKYRQIMLARQLMLKSTNHHKCG